MLNCLSAFRKQLNCQLVRKSPIYPSKLINHHIRLYSQQKPKEFGILVCGEPPSSQLIEKHGDYGNFMIELLAQPESPEIWHTFYCFKDEFPSASDLKNMSAIVITGSKFDAHCNENEWILKLRAMIMKIYRDSIANPITSKSEVPKILGICFGHQIISHSLSEFGGQSGKCKNCKSELGLRYIHPTFVEHEIWQKFRSFCDHSYSISCFESGNLPIFQTHGDSVYSLPSDIQSCSLLAYSENCEIEMYSISDHILCMQGHPEFTKQYMLDLIHYRCISGIVSLEEKNEIEDSLKNIDAEELSMVWKTFLQYWIRE